MLHIPRTGGSFINKKFEVKQEKNVSEKHHFLCHSYENTIDPNLFNLIDQVDFVVFRNPYGYL